MCLQNVADATNTSPGTGEPTSPLPSVPGFRTDLNVGNVGGAGREIGDEDDVDYIFYNDDSTDDEEVQDYNGFSYKDSDTFLEGSRVSFDFVDTYLFSRLQSECQCILDKLRERLKVLSDVTPAVILDLFLPNSLLSLFADVSNARLKQRNLAPVDLDELRECIVAYLRCAVYRASFTTTFDPKEGRWYGLDGGLNVSLHRCLDVLKSLSGPAPRSSRIEWEHVSDEMRGLLGRIEEMVCSTNKCILMTSKTILSIDDDHIRQRSRRVKEQTDLKVVNNPKKAIGPVQTACCSALTGAFISGHYSIREENLRSTFEKLFMFIQSARHPDDIKVMRDLIIAADRGYLSKDTVDFINYTLQASFIGTHKRVHGYPFVYGSNGIALKHRGLRIPDKGGRAVFYATAISKPRGSRAHRKAVKMTAVAFREAVNGRVALFLTSVKEFATGWSTVSRRTALHNGAGEEPLPFKVIFQAPRGDSSETELGDNRLNNLKLDRILKRLMPLTVQQSIYKGWFILRAFRFTSRTCAGYLRILREAMIEGCSFITTEEKRLVGLVYSSVSESDAHTDVRKEREWCIKEVLQMVTVLKSFHVPELNRLLRGLGLSMGGRKAEKVKRLEAEASRLRNIMSNTGSSVERLAQQTSSVMEVITEFSELRTRFLETALDSWTMKPTVRDNDSMQLGRLNEPIVLQKLSNFLQEGNSPFQVLTILECGLVSTRQSDYNIMADSPDGVATFQNTFNTDIVASQARNCFVAALEVKTLTSERTKSKGYDISETYGTSFRVDTRNEDDLYRYNETTLQSEYRCQCLHHAAVLGVKDVVFIVADPTRILFVIHIHYGDDIIQSYCNYLLKVRDMAFSWIGKKAANLPTYVLSVACPEDECTKVEAFLSFYGLCMSVSKVIKDNGKALRPLLQIRPTVTLAWNALKGGTDEFSRALSLLKVEIVGSHPNCKYILRFILTQVYNACVSYRLVLFEQKESISGVTRESYKALRKKITKQISLTEFVRRLIDEVLGQKDAKMTLAGNHPDFADKPLQNRFNRNILQSFRSREMWDVRSKGVHSLKHQPKLQLHDGNGTKVTKRFRKSCVACSNMTSRESRLKKPGKKTSWVCERCKVPLCSPVGKSKGEAHCWDWFHGSRFLDITKIANFSSQPSSEGTAHTNIGRMQREEPDQEPRILRSRTRRIPGPSQNEQLVRSRISRPSIIPPPEEEKKTLRAFNRKGKCHIGSAFY